MSGQHLGQKRTCTSYNIATDVRYISVGNQNMQGLFAYCSIPLVKANLTFYTNPSDKQFCHVTP